LLEKLWPTRARPLTGLFLFSAVAGVLVFKEAGSDSLHSALQYFHRYRPLKGFRSRPPDDALPQQPPFVDLLLSSRANVHADSYYYGNGVCRHGTSTRPQNMVHKQLTRGPTSISFKADGRPAAGCLLRGGPRRLCIFSFEHKQTPTRILGPATLHHATGLQSETACSSRCRPASWLIVEMFAGLLNGHNRGASATSHPLI